MKRILSILLVAIMIAASLSTIVFAAGSATVSGNTKTAKPGEEVTLTFTVSGEFANYQLVLGTSSPLQIVSITGATANVNNGKVAWASDENVSSHSFSVTVKVAETAAPGTYPVNVAVDKIRDRNGELLSASASAGYVVIEEPACDHNWELIDSKESTCVEHGYNKYQCSKCGDIYTETLELGDHKLNANWLFDTEKHWHVCDVCGQEFEHGEHYMQYYPEKSVEPTETEDGYKYFQCDTCAYEYTSVWKKGQDPVPGTGDPTPAIALGVASVITLAGTSLYVFKRKK